MKLVVDISDETYRLVKEVRKDADGFLKDVLDIIANGDEWELVEPQESGGKE